jgi:hypothetical protein
MSRCYLLVLLMLMLVPVGAVAEDEPAAAGEDAAAADTAQADANAELADEAAAATAEPVNYSRYEATDFGFSTELPEGGVITGPSSPDWNEEPAAAFKWQATGDEPIRLIIGRVDSFNTEMDELTFSIICGTMLESWEADPTMYKVVTANEPLIIEGDGAGGKQRQWNLIEVEDYSHSDGKPVYYSVFSTYEGEYIYSIMMYYLE